MVFSTNNKMNNERPLQSSFDSAKECWPCTFLSIVTDTLEMANLFTTNYLR